MAERLQSMPNFTGDPEQAIAELRAWYKCVATSSTRRHSYTEVHPPLEQEAPRHSSGRSHSFV